MSPNNAVILTSGLSGSSVLAGLLVRGGFWPGTETARKEDYETFENADLVSLNMRLFEEAGYRGDYTREVSRQAIADIAGLDGRIDDAPFGAMVEKCEQHRPWLWKDPRLWLTIRFWRKFLDLQECRFIHLTRAPWPLWISSLLRRQVTSFRFLRTYEAEISALITGFLEENRLSSLRVTYEELILKPDDTIARLNRYLGTALSVADLEAVYTRPLYRNPGSSLASCAKALLIYARNYSERRDLGSAGTAPPSSGQAVEADRRPETFDHGSRQIPTAAKRNEDEA